MVLFPDAPPEDVEALVFGLTVTVKSTRRAESDGSLEVEFDFHCEDCGGCVLNLPLGTEPNDPTLCKACGRLFGNYKAVLALCRDTFRRYSTGAVSVP